MSVQGREGGTPASGPRSLPEGQVTGLPPPLPPPQDRIRTGVPPYSQTANTTDRIRHDGKPLVEDFLVL